jgi:hypothetical protein
VLAGPLAQPRTPGVRFAGLRTVAFDGLNSLKIPDSERNRGWLGRVRYQLGFAGYPTVRLLCLVETGTRGLLGAAIGEVIGRAGDRDESHLARLLPLLRQERRLEADLTLRGARGAVVAAGAERVDRGTVQPRQHRSDRGRGARVPGRQLCPRW